MRGKRGILHDLGILTVAQAATQLLNVVALVYVARAVGAHWFGVLQIGVAVSAYALITAEWGMFSSGVRAVSRLDDPRDVHRYASRHVGLLSALAIVVLAAGALLLPLLPFFREEPLVFLLYLLSVVPQVGMLDWVGVGLERMLWVGIAKVGRSLVYSVAVLLLLSSLAGRLGWPAYRWVPVIFLVSLLAGDLLIWGPVARWLGRPVWPAFGGWPDWRERLAVAGPIGGGIVVMRLLLNIDIIALGVLARPDVVGSYAAAGKIVFVLVTAVEVLWNAMLPRLSRLWRESPERFRSRLQLYLGLILAGFVPLAAGGMLLGGRLMDLLYGTQYPGAGLVFRVLSLSYVLLAVGQFFGNALIASDRQRAVFPPVALAAAVALGGNLLLVPRYGAGGACFAMLAAHATLLLVTGWICRALIGRTLLAAAGIAAAGAAAMALLLSRLPVWPLPVLVAIGIAAYGVLAGPWLWSWTRRARAAA